MVRWITNKHILIYCKVCRDCAWMKNKYTQCCSFVIDYQHGVNAHRLMEWMRSFSNISRGTFNQYELTLISTWMTKHASGKVFVEITYPFSNFNGCTVEVWEWKSNFIFYWHCRILWLLVHLLSGNVSLISRTQCNTHWLICHVYGNRYSLCHNLTVRFWILISAMAPEWNYWR